MTRTSLLALALTAAIAAPLVATQAPASTCGEPICDPEAVRRDTEPLTAEEKAMRDHELLLSDVRGAREVMGRIHHDIASLSPEDRAAASASLQELAVTCAYTRASLQLPVVLHQVAMSLDPDDVDRLVDQDLAYLQRGLSAHVATLELLDAHALQVPQRGDALFGQAAWVDQTQLELSTDAVYALSPTIDAASIDLEEGPVLDRIRHHTARAEALIGHPWALQNQHRGWMSALQRLEPFVTDPEARRRVNDAILLLRSYQSTEC